MSEDKIAPQVVTSEASNLEVDADSLADIMQIEYGISPELVANTTVLIDDKNHLSYKGSQTTKLLDRLVRGREDYNDGDGSVVRISSKFRGIERTPDEMNVTLAHELEHVGQMDRKDWGIKVGNFMIWGSAVVGAALGYGLIKDRNNIAKISATLTGAISGQKIGYILAPHERHARSRAKRTKINAIQRKTE